LCKPWILQRLDLHMYVDVILVVMCKKNHTFVIGYTRWNKTKQKHNTMYVGHHYAHTHTINENKTCALQETTGKSGTKHRLCEIDVNITNVWFFLHITTILCKPWILQRLDLHMYVDVILVVMCKKNHTFVMFTSISQGSLRINVPLLHWN
jgi:hypothetical protein